MAIFIMRTAFVPEGQDTSQRELTNSPGKPVANLFCCPAPRVTWDPELGSNPIPGAVRACQQLTHRGGRRWGVEGGAVHLLLDVVGGAGCGGGVVRLHGVAVQAVRAHEFRCVRGPGSRLGLSGGGDVGLAGGEQVGGGGPVRYESRQQFPGAPCLPTCPAWPAASSTHRPQCSREGLRCQGSRERGHAWH